MLKHFREDWGEGYRTIVDCLVTIPFFENWRDVGIEPVIWKLAAIQGPLKYFGDSWGDFIGAFFKDPVGNIVRLNCLVDIEAL